MSQRRWMRAVSHVTFPHLKPSAVNVLRSAAVPSLAAVCVHDITARQVGYRGGVSDAEPAGVHWGSCCGGWGAGRAEQVAKVTLGLASMGHSVLAQVRAAVTFMLWSAVLFLPVGAGHVLHSCSAELEPGHCRRLHRLF